jgi:uncharacterized protein YbjT (DUF2867 family)
MILITGASGSAGGAVLREVAGSGAEFCAMYRSKDDAAKAPAGTRTVIADFSDRASLGRALEGIERVYIVCAPIPQLVELEGNMIDACKQAGVGHIVLNSAFGAGDFPKSFPGWHFQAEQKLRNSGIAHTILRPNGFLQNIVTYFAPSIRTQGAFNTSIGEAKISLIDVRDVSAVAAKILFEPQSHAGKTYELHGPEAVSNYAVAERISRIAGREVSYVDISEDAMRKAMLDVGMPETFVNAEIELEGYYRSGRCGVIDGLVARLLGRPERALDAYLRENVAAFQSQAATA